MDSNQAIESYTFFLQANDNLGAMEISTFVGMGLFGTAMGQVHQYFSKSKGDRLFLKLFVSLLTILEIMHTFTSVQAIYFATITEWQVAKPNSYPSSYTIVLESLITVFVQGFFSYRIFTFSRRIPLALVCLLLTFTRFVGVFSISILALIDVPKTPNGLVVHTYSTLITSSLAVGAAVDLLIAASLIYYLRTMFSSLASSRTSEVINRLVRWSLQTGLITSLMSVAIIICFQTMPNMIWFGLYVVLAKLYSISLLVSLNSRQSYCSMLTGPPPAYKEKTTTLRFEHGLSVVSIESLTYKGHPEGGSH